VKVGGEVFAAEIVGERGAATAQLGEPRAALDDDLVFVWGG